MVEYLKSHTSTLYEKRKLNKEELAFVQNSILQSLEEIEKAKQRNDILVFSGGSSNVIDKFGRRVRGDTRDTVNFMLMNLENVAVTDPQIHPDTHGEDYDHAKHYPVEQFAVKEADVVSIEINSNTLSPVSALEVMRGVLLNQNQVDEGQIATQRIVWFSDAYPAAKLFIPRANGQHTNIEGEVVKAREMHFEEYKKALLRTREDFVKFLTKKEIKEEQVRINYIDDKDLSDNPIYELTENDDVYTLNLGFEGLQLEDMINAYKAVIEGKQLIANIYGVSSYSQINNVSLMTNVESNSWLEDYQQEGRLMRVGLMSYLKEKSKDKNLNLSVAFGKVQTFEKLIAAVNKSKVKKRNPVLG